MLSAAHTWSLTVIAVITGVMLLLIWKRFSNQERIVRAKRRMRAQLYAMRLYADEPAIVFRAQGQLLIWIARYLAGTLRPMAVAIVPLLLLFPPLENAYGHRPLAPGESAIVTARFPAAAAAHMAAATLEGRGVSVETPGVHLPDAREVCWRVRTMAEVPGSVVLDAGGVAIAECIPCGRALDMPAGHWDKLPSIDVSCPAANLNVFGFAVIWPAWFLVVALLTMLALRKRLGVAL